MGKSKKSRKKQKTSVQNLAKPVKNSPKTVDNNVDKSTRIVENSTKSVDNSAKTCAKPANNSAKSVEKASGSCANPVQNSQESAQNSVDNPVQKSKNPVKSPDSTKNPAEPTSPSADFTEVESNPTCKRITSSNSASSNPASSNPAVIKVTNLHKSFRLPTERAAGLKQAIFNGLKGIKGYTEHQVLKGIDFEVRAGEFLGIVGRNGSGKSTLLKILAQIYYPEQGSIEVHGTLVPFIELGVGFNPELTGRENVYLNGALLGFSRPEMDAMYEEIVNFAELQPFMDAKLKNYSSGMQVRLAFSIAIRAKGDILILDEVLAVGDAEFQQKCNDYFASLHGSQTVILVTHSMENVRRFCDRAILIEDGKIATEGDPEDVAKAYEGLWN